MYFSNINRQASRCDSYRNPQVVNVQRIREVTSFISYLLSPRTEALWKLTNKIPGYRGMDRKLFLSVCGNGSSVCWRTQQFPQMYLSTLELLPPVCDNSDILSLIAELGKANVFCSLVKGKDFVLGRKERVGKPCSDVFSCLGILSWRIMCNSSISF